MLPDWPEGTVAVLATSGPHAIPVSTATRGGDATVHLATVVAEDDRLAYLRLDVHEVQDHDQPTFELDDGVRWHWTDGDAEAGDTRVRDRLRRL